MLNSDTIVYFSFSYEQYTSSIDKGFPMGKISALFETAMGMVLFGLYSLVGIGSLYWLWMAIQLESFMMFVVGIFPLFIIITAPIGTWSLLFGIPDWVYNIFG